MKAGCIYVSYPFPNANGHYIQELNITPDVTITLFDFDFCGNCLIALDSSYYLLHTVVDAFYKKRESFLADYESLSEISDDGKRVLPMMGKSIYLYYIGGQCDRFGNWSNSCTPCLVALPAPGSTWVARHWLACSAAPNGPH